MILYVVAAHELYGKATGMELKQVMVRLYDQKEISESYFVVFFSPMYHLLLHMQFFK